MGRHCLFPSQKFLLPKSDNLWNVYGPTETCIWSTAFRVVDPEAIFIGRPIEHTTVYILKRDTKTFTLAPRGDVGELWIGGTGLARGYIKRPDLTENAFVSGTPFGRIYKTGDLARWNEAGDLEYHGRIDFQVKLHGYRIELGEIENVCGGVPGVGGSCALVKNEVLVVWIWPRAVDLEAVKKACTANLAYYMIPTFYQTCDEFPLSSAGKIDRKVIKQWAIKINETGDDHDTSSSFEMSESETQMIAAFADILGVEGVRRCAATFSSLEATRSLCSFSQLASYLSLVSSLAQRNFFILRRLRVCSRSYAKKALSAISSPLHMERVDRADGTRTTFPSSLVQMRLGVVMNMDPTNVAFNLPLNLSFPDL